MQNPQRSRFQRANATLALKIESVYLTLCFRICSPIIAVKADGLMMCDYALTYQPQPLIIDRHGHL